MSLKVFDLLCEHGHVFEGWFASADNFESQQARGLLTCPVCDSHKVTKKLSAPRLNVSHIRNESANDAAQQQRSGAAVAAPSGVQIAQFQAEMLQRLRQVIRNTEDVGSRFADEARRMHEGEAQERAIRGTATAEEQEELVEEGIAVMPIPAFLDDERLQ
jgi:hypothetical protein